MTTLSHNGVLRGTEARRAIAPNALKLNRASLKSLSKNPGLPSQTQFWCMRYASKQGFATGLRQPRTLICAASGNDALDIPDPTKYVLPYQLLQAAYAVLGAILVAVPARVLEMSLQMPVTLASVTVLQVYGADLVLGAVVLQCLKEAAVHNRLSSDTYKRLNLGLMYWSIIRLVLTAKFWPAMTEGLQRPAFIILKLATVLIAGRAYRHSNNNTISLFTIVRGFFNGLQNLLDVRTITSALYASLSAACLVCFFIQVAGGLHPLLGPGSGGVVLESVLHRFMSSGLLLLGVVLYVQKDAADRSRLSASTFRTLNLGLLGVSAVQAYAYGRALSLQSSVGAAGPLLIGLAAVTSITGMLSGFAYIVSR